MAPIPYCFYWDLYKFGIASISHVSDHLEIEVISSQAFSAHNAGLPTFCQPFLVQMYKNTVHLP